MLKLLVVVTYFVASMGLLVWAIWWSRKQKRLGKAGPRQLSPTARYFLQELPPNWYVSVAFCVGFALAGVITVIVYKVFVAMFPD